MGDKSAIEWTNATWNPVTGCTKVSPGCKHCYAERLAERLQAMGVARYRNGFEVTLHPDVLGLPLRWSRPRMIFVNSMSDLFHEDVPEEFIDRVFAVMALCPQHTFQVLTKRTERMRAYMAGASNGATREVAVTATMDQERWTWLPKGRGFPRYPAAWPLPNVWLGTSVEDQRRANERIPHLLRTPAAVRFLSCEPLLGPIDLNRVDYSAYLREFMREVAGEDGARSITAPAYLSATDGSFFDGVDVGGPSDAKVHWVIVGGESGPDHRPMRAEWARRIRDQCYAAGVAFFFKQWGGPTPKAGGRVLDGRTWNEMPGVAAMVL